MAEFKPDPKPSPPAYMVSFCDMMTLILTFFILLVSMAKERQVGLLASGVGSFIVAIKSHGLNGIMSGSEKADVFEHVRRKFNVPMDEDDERKTELVSASNLEVMRAKLAQAMQPHEELTYPEVVEFPPGEASVPGDKLPYLDELAASLQPKYRQVLVIEGHADDAGETYGNDNVQLAAARAMYIRDYLIKTYGFKADRVEARVWRSEVPMNGRSNRAADIRLITPEPRTADK